MYESVRNRAGIHIWVRAGPDGTATGKVADPTEVDPDPTFEKNRIRIQSSKKTQIQPNFDLIKTALFPCESRYDLYFLIIFYKTE